MINIERLKDIRNDKDYTQKDIANYLNISQVQYSRYETGIRIIPIDLLAKLAKLYQVSIDYLLGLTDVRNPYPPSKIYNKTTIKS